MKNAENIEGIRKRLHDAVEKHPDSRRAILERAGLGPSYLYGVLTEKKEPGVDSIMRLCAAMGVSSEYILFGYELNTDTSQIIRLLEEHPEKRQHLLALLGQ